jgi:ribose 5-phosphate isomerase RpiB
VYDINALEMAVRHNCANFFAFPAKMYSDLSNLEEEEKIKDIVNKLASYTFDGGRHQNRVQQINALEEN